MEAGDSGGADSAFGAVWGWVRRGGWGIGSVSGGLGEFYDFEALAGLEVAFAAKPVVHGSVEAVDGDAMAGFEQAVGDGEGVVEDGVGSEVAHGKAVDVAQRAGMALARRVDALDGQAAGEHGNRVNE
jgi:hypothetical protein